MLHQSYILVPVILWPASRERKGLSYVVESDYGLVPVEDRRIEQNLQVLLKSKPVQHLIVVQIGNTGNKEILAMDFEDQQPVSSCFGTEAHVVDIEVLEEETKPPSLYQRARERVRI